MSEHRNSTRRSFLTAGGVSALWLVSGCNRHLGGRVLGSYPNPLVAPTLGSEIDTSAAPLVTPSDSVLVVVQMLGGNDGLNTVIPDDGRYVDARPGLVIPEAERIRLSGLDGLSLHPSLAALQPYWDTQHLAIALGTGFQSQTRSHFQSRDVWWRAGDDPAGDGWLARWLDAAGAQADAGALGGQIEAVALGAGPRALAGSAASAVSDPESFELTGPAGMSDAEFEEFLLAVAQGDPGDGLQLEAVRSSLPVALSTKKILDDAGDDSAGDAYGLDPGVALAVQLQTAASLIATRPALRVITVGIDGFDTHANQLQTQSELLAQVSASLVGFWESLSSVDQERTMIMTTSEFGRRVGENGSGGTDHGRGGVQFVLGGRRADGSGVQGGQMLGHFDLGSLVDGDLPIVVPAEELYGEALRWLGGPVQEVLGAETAATGLLA